jgi:hypothetical protein
LDFRGKRVQPVIATEQQADPVQTFQRLNAEQQRRLLQRIAPS